MEQNMETELEYTLVHAASNEAELEQVNAAGAILEDLVREGLLWRYPHAAGTELRYWATAAVPRPHDAYRPNDETGG